MLFVTLAVFARTANHDFINFDDTIYVTANPGKPGDATVTLVYFIYENGFRNFKMGLASAASWILFLIVAVVTILYFRTQKRWVHCQ